VRGGDSRSPVVILRSFRDDAIGLRSSKAFAIPFRYEQAIAEVLRDLGPVIAIGEPGEGLPQIGAARAYVSDNEWQEVVKRWIDEAAVIALLAGDTHWLRWEIEQVIEARKLDRVFVMLPPIGSEHRWPNVRAAFRESYDHKCDYRAFHQRRPNHRDKQQRKNTGALWHRHFDSSLRDLRLQPQRN
jgi:hypothetical protein